MLKNQELEVARATPDEQDRDDGDGGQGGDDGDGGQGGDGGEDGDTFRLLLADIDEDEYRGM